LITFYFSAGLSKFGLCWNFGCCGAAAAAEAAAAEAADPLGWLN